MAGIFWGLVLLLSTLNTVEIVALGPGHHAGIKDVVISHINGSAIQEQLQTLATFSEGTPPGITRVLFTQADVAARNYIKSLMEDAGLVVKEDSMGSIFGTLYGKNLSAPAVATGSHCDAIPNSGAYDGTVGVLGGIAALKAMTTAGYQPSRSIHVIMFTSEEPTRFGLSCLGSRAMSGALSAAALATLRDANDSGFLDAARHARSNSLYTCEEDVLSNARLTELDISGFVELHIEQGPELERLGVPIGVVTSIAAPATLKITFRGSGGHAGSLLMHQRFDPSLAAASLALEVEAAAKESGSQDTVATVGQWLVHPNAVNAVPENVTLMIDVRDIDGLQRDKTVTRIVNAAKEIARQRLKVSLVSHAPRSQPQTDPLEIEIVNSDDPARCSPSMVQTIEAAAAGLKLKSHKMVSRAYHDALFMSRIAPTGMIFIPCADGKSHRPDEFATTSDIETGTMVLASSLVRLAEGGLGEDVSFSASDLDHHHSDEL